MTSVPFGRNPAMMSAGAESSANGCFTAPSRAQIFASAVATNARAPLYIGPAVILAPTPTWKSAAARSEYVHMLRSDPPNENPHGGARLKSVVMWGGVRIAHESTPASVNE